MKIRGHFNINNNTRISSIIKHQHQPRPLRYQRLTCEDGSRNEAQWISEDDSPGILGKKKQPSYWITGCQCMTSRWLMDMRWIVLVFTWLKRVLLVRTCNPLCFMRSIDISCFFMDSWQSQLSCWNLWCCRVSRARFDTGPGANCSKHFFHTLVFQTWKELISVSQSLFASWATEEHMFELLLQLRPAWVDRKIGLPMSGSLLPNAIVREWKVKDLENWGLLKSGDLGWCFDAVV